MLHRRAKYLLFIPRDYQHLPANSMEKMIGEGRRAEVKTMQRLRSYYEGQPNDGDDWGIIGRRQGELTQQLPSGMYWGLLRQLGILREQGSLADYCRRRVDAAKEHAARSVLHEEGEVVESDGSPWTELPGGEFTGFTLNREEAEWLRQRFLATEQDRPEAQRSLVAWLLDPARTTWWTDVANAWQHPERDQFPTTTSRVMYLGRDLDAFVHSARITYNYLCADGRPDLGETRDKLMAKYEAAMASWQAGIEQNLITTDRLAELDAWAGEALTAAQATYPARQRWALTYAFLTEWQKIAAGPDDLLQSADAAGLLKRRESWLKQGRARLGNVDLLRGWAGDSGYFHLDYNWSIAMLICRDIHDGLGTPTRTAIEVA